MKKHFFCIAALVLMGISLVLLSEEYGEGPELSFRAVEASTTEPEAEPSQTPAPEPTPEPMPQPLYFDGARVDDATQSVTLHLSSNLEELASMADRLTALRQIDFADRQPTREELALLRGAYPEAELLYHVHIGTENYSPDTETLDLSFLRRDGVDEALRAVALLEKLQYLDLGQETEEEDSLTLEDVGKFQELCPEVPVAFTFSRFNQTLSTLDEILNFRDIPMTDEGEEVRSFLPYMTRCKTLDMDKCGVSNEVMASIRDEYPQMEVIWRVRIGYVYGARTDETRILMSIGSPCLRTKDVEPLKYCTKVKYLDLGHNQIDDISFVKYMPDLEVAILALNLWSDASPLAECKKLEYLEIFTTRCKDLSPLAELTNLRHLNVCQLTALEDISPLYGLTGLERLWIGPNNMVPKEQLETIREMLPDCQINTTIGDPTRGGWRVGPRYALLKEQMKYVTSPTNYETQYSFY